MFERYGIYYTCHGPLGAAGAKWLGWDSANAVESAAQAYTKRPRKYGFHATLKAPFALAEGKNEAALHDAFTKLCTTLSPVSLDGLHLQIIGRFLALTPKGDDAAVKTLAASVVRELDTFRAPMSAEEQAKRLKGRLSEAQIANVARWGYPHVMAQFQFHMTLTGPLKPPQMQTVHHEAARLFEPLLPSPFTLAHLTLVGERADGYFVEINRQALTG